MQHIATVTVPSGGVSSITFMAVGDIPATFTDLVLKVSSRTTNTDRVYGFVRLAFNGITTGQVYRNLQGSGSGVGSFTDTNGQMGMSASNGATANTFGNMEIYIPNYRSNVAKSVSVDNVTENNGTESYQQIQATSWNGTAAITSMSFTATNATGGGANFGEHTSISLYGITAGSDGTTIVS